MKFLQLFRTHLVRLGKADRRSNSRPLLSWREQKKRPLYLVAEWAGSESYHRAVETKELPSGWIEADEIFSTQRPELPLAPLRTVDDVQAWLQEILNASNALGTDAATDPAYVLRLWVRYRQAELWFRDYGVTNMPPVTPTAYRAAVIWSKTRNGGEPSLEDAQRAIAQLLDASREIGKAHV